MGIHQLHWNSSSFTLNAGPGDSSGPGEGCLGDRSCGNGGEVGHDQEVEVIQAGAQEMRFGTGKKLGKDGCGY